MTRRRREGAGGDSSGGPPVHQKSDERGKLAFRPATATGAQGFATLVDLAELIDLALAVVAEKIQPGMPAGRPVALEPGDAPRDTFALGDVTGSPDFVPSFRRHAEQIAPVLLQNLTTSMFVEIAQTIAAEAFRLAAKEGADACGLPPVEPELHRALDAFRRNAALDEVDRRHPAITRPGAPRRLVDIRTLCMFKKVTDNVAPFMGRVCRMARSRTFDWRKDLLARDATYLAMTAEQRAAVDAVAEDIAQGFETKPKLVAMLYARKAFGSDWDKLTGGRGDSPRSLQALYAEAEGVMADYAAAGASI